ncbi:hypothetical protein RJ639_034750 [Escallonia herrerae]|uniref:Uncharacterized protein n=1 Tax=Escallonia herrerae TaxID=1293975 RepID=A0AA88X4J6_9ASTE|nr:hypothetical protein RJ639_034750 [Escallonia herrerae]
MNLISLPCTCSRHALLHPSTVSCFHKDPKKVKVPTTLKTTAVSATIPARDRVIDFGKHKGRMLGTLPSNYLKWVSKNLRARDFEDWAKLADQVLEDPVYRDRIEWEFAENLLNGDVLSSPASRSDQGAVAELLEMSERFGWDNEDKVGWSRINFGLLGTSKGGRIPRDSDGGGGDGRRKVEMKRQKVGAMGGERRRERRDRMRSKRGTTDTANGATAADSGMQFDDENGDNQVKSELDGDRTAQVSSPFPGRGALFKKVLNRRKL